MNTTLFFYRYLHRSYRSAAQKASQEISTQQKTGVQVAEGKVKILDKEKVRIFSKSNVPFNFNYPNPKGVEGYDPEFTLKEIVSDIPKIAKEQARLLKKEFQAFEGTFEKKELLEDLGLLRDREARVEYRFDSPEALKLWHTGCDSNWNEGYSTVQWIPTDRGTSLFKGTISTDIVKDGRVERAGWAAIKLEDRRSLNRKKYLSHWKNFSHLLIKCRGDGRSYKVMLHSPLAMDYTWGDSFSYALHTHGGPYWQYEKIPFSKFFHTVNGRIQDRQYRVNLEDVSSMGIVLMDRIDGDFQLELEYIGVFNDRSHVEEFAYETYTLPLWNSHGF